MGAYADLSSLGDSAVPGRAKWLVNTVAFLVVLTVGGFAISGWYMYTLKVKYDDFNRNFNGNWSETVDRINVIQPEVNANKASLATLNQDVSNHDAKIIADESQLDAQLSSITANQQALSTNVVAIQSNQVAVAGLEQNQSVIQATISTQIKNYTSLNSNVAKNAGDIKGLQSAGAGRDITIKNASTLVASLSSSIKTLTTQLSSAQSTILVQSATISSNIDSIDGNTKQVDSFINLITAYTTQIGDVNKSLNAEKASRVVAEQSIQSALSKAIASIDSISLTGTAMKASTQKTLTCAEGANKQPTLPVNTLCTCQTTPVTVGAVLLTPPSTVGCDCFSNETKIASFTTFCVAAAAAARDEL